MKQQRFNQGVAKITPLILAARLPPLLITETEVDHDGEKHDAFMIAPGPLGIIICAHLIEDTEGDTVAQSKLVTHLWWHFIWAIAYSSSMEGPEAHW